MVTSTVVVPLAPIGGAELRSRVTTGEVPPVPANSAFRFELFKPFQTLRFAPDGPPLLPSSLSYRE